MKRTLFYSLLLISCFLVYHYSVKEAGKVDEFVPVKIEKIDRTPPESYEIVLLLKESPKGQYYLRVYEDGELLVGVFIYNKLYKGDKYTLFLNEKRYPNGELVAKAVSTKEEDLDVEIEVVEVKEYKG